MAEQAEEANVEVTDGEFADGEEEVLEFPPYRALVIVRHGIATVQSNDSDIHTVVVDLDVLRVQKEAAFPLGLDEFYEDFVGLEELVSSVLSMCLLCEEDALPTRFFCAQHEPKKEAENFGEETDEDCALCGDKALKLTALCRGHSSQYA